MSRSCRILLACFLELALLNVPRPLPAQSSDQALLDKIAEAWRRREEATRSVEIVWEETETIPRDALTNHPALKRFLKAGENKTTLPSADTTLTHRGQALLEANRVRYAGERERLGDKADIWHETYASAYDGSQTKTLRRSSRAEWPSGQIWNEPFFHDRSALELAPLCYSLRPGNAIFGGVDLSACRVSRARPGNGSGNRVVLVEDTAPGSRIEYWLSPEADYAIVRKIAISSGKIETDDEIRYTRDTSSGVWAPSGWTITWFKLWDGKIHFTLSGRVTACKLKVTSPPGAFDFEFPSDALVSIMGNTPETTIDLIEPRRSWLEWVVAVGSLIAASLLAGRFLRRRWQSRKRP